MTRIVVRPQAEQDLRELWHYIAQQASPEQADRFADQIQRKLALLAPHPLMGRQRDELRRGLRSLVIGRYLAFYVPLEDGIDVVRVLYGGRDLASLFDEETDPNA